MNPCGAITYTHELYLSGDISQITLDLSLEETLDTCDALLYRLPKEAVLKWLEKQKEQQS